jgi:hypothetical protein
VDFETRKGRCVVANIFLNKYCGREIFHMNIIELTISLYA